MLNFSCLKSTAYLSQRWKNGKGRTMEIAIDTSTPYRWRLSTADLVESGEFSVFSGYQRHLTLLCGCARISSGGAPPVELPILKPYEFSGDSLTTCELIERGRDLNLFCLKGKARGECCPTRFKENEEMHFPLDGQEHFLYCVDGEIEIIEQNTSQQNILKSNDTARFTCDPTMEFLDIKTIARSHALAIWIVIHVR